MTRRKVIDLLNTALELEHSARIQYLSHAETLFGLDSEPIIVRLKEIAGDELKHEEMFREQIGALGGVPSMKFAPTLQADGIKKVLEVNLKGETDAIDFYRKILEEIRNSKDELKYEDLRLEHQVRHVIMDEMEHAQELKLLLG